LSTIALTDHDTLEGLEEAAIAAAATGIGFIRGTELSVEWPTGGMHLLVYYLGNGGPLQDRLGEIRSGRATRNARIAARLQELGLDITLEAVEAEAGSGVTGRPHFAAVMVERGYATDIPDAFERYLAAGRPGYVARTKLGAEEAIQLATESGAVAVIAHPHTIGTGEADYRHAFETLAAAGLGGIEAYYADYPPELREHLAGICRDLGLVATGGSDYHGRYKAGLRIGVGHGDLHVPDEVVTHLEGVRDAVRRRR
jgi:predicted metal-dependent phosphoesterase TrpH